MRISRDASFGFAMDRQDIPCRSGGTNKTRPLTECQPTFHQPRNRYLLPGVVFCIASSMELASIALAIPMSVIAIEDNHVRFGAEANTVQNAAGSGTINVAKTIANTSFNRRIWVKFDLSGHDLDTSAAAQFNFVQVASASPATSFDLSIHGLASGFTPGLGELGTNWTEETITWNNAPGNNAADPSGSAFYDDAFQLAFIPFVPNAAIIPHSVLLPTLSDYLQADNTLTMIITVNQQGNSNSQIDFASKEHADVSFRPTLTFETLPPPSPAVMQWNNAAGGDSATAANWLNLTDARPGPPLAVDRAVFNSIGNSGSGFTVDFQADTTHKELTLSADNDITFNLNSNTYHLTETNGLRSITLDLPGSLTINNGTLKADTGIWHEQGTLNINSNGIVEADFLRAGFSGNSAYINVTGTGQLLTANYMVIGDQPANSGSYAELNIEGGGTVQVENAMGIGGMGGNTGVVSVRGVGSTLQSLGGTNSLFDPSITVGQQGVGELHIESGGHVEAAFINIGQSGSIALGSTDNGMGTLTVDNATLNAAGIRVGLLGLSASSGIGDITIRNGAIANAGSLSVLWGTADIEGTGTFLLGNLLIGSRGEATVRDSATIFGGRLAMESGGTLIVEDATVELTSSTLSSDVNGHAIFDNSNLTSSFAMSVGSDLFPTPNASIELTNGTTANFAGTFQIGRNSEGRLEISGGSQLTSGPIPSASATSGMIGVFANVSGNATVTGANSKWLNTGNFVVGFFGAGVARIEDGGLIAADANAFIGREVGSTGTLTVTGTGSTFDVGQSLGIGGTLDTLGGTGTLHIEQNARLLVGHQLVLWENGQLHLTTSGTANVGDEFLGTIPANTLRIGTNGSLEGDGTIFADVWLDGGSIAPGHSPGSLDIIGSLIASSSSITRLEIAGNTTGLYDVLSTTGTLDLAGIIQIILDGYAPQHGDTFDFLNFGSLIDSGFTLDLPFIAGFQWNTNSFRSDGTLIVQAVQPNGAAIPEPASLLMILLSTGMLASRRRCTSGKGQRHNDSLRNG